MHTKIVPGIFLSLLTISLVPLAASAQGQSPTNVPAVQSVVFADLNLVDVTATEKDGVWSGHYSLQNGMGLQSGIDVGMVVYDDSNKIVDAKTLDHNLSIQEGDLKVFSFSYTLPSYASGEVKLLLVAETSSGLPLSAGPVGTTTAKGTSTSGLSCSPGTTTTPTITCTAKKSGTVSFSYSTRGLFNSVTKFDSKPITAGGKVVFTPSISAGKYLARLSFTETGETSFIPFTMPGDFGTVSSVSVSSHTSGSVHAVVVASLGVTSKTANVSVHLTDTSGAECGSATEPLMAQTIASFDIPTTCTEGSVTVSLMGANGVTLDTKTQPFSVISLAPPVQTASSPIGSLSITVKYGLIGIALLIVLGGGFWYYQRKRNAMQNGDTMGMTDATKMMSAALILISSFGMFAPRASALSVSLFCYPSVCPNMDSTIYANYKLDRSTYNPGQAVSFNTFFNSDDHPYPATGIDLLAQIVSSPNGWDTSDLYPGTTPVTDLTSGIVSVNKVVGTAPATPGTYSSLAKVAANGYGVVPAGTLNLAVAPGCNNNDVEQSSDLCPAACNSPYATINSVILWSGTQEWWESTNPACDARACMGGVIRYKTAAQLAALQACTASVNIHF